MMHACPRFRIALTLNGLAQLSARLRSGGEIVLLALGPAILGLLACAALQAFHIGETARQPVSGLSLGQYKKLQLALALARRAAARDCCIVLTSHLPLRVAPTCTLDLDARPGVL